MKAEEILKTKSNGCAYEYSHGLHVLPFTEAVSAMHEYAEQVVKSVLERVAENVKPVMSVYDAKQSILETEYKDLIK